MLSNRESIRSIRISKKLLFIGVLSLIIFFFVGVINLDSEFWEQPRWFIKIPPTYKFSFGASVIDLNEAANQIQYEKVLAANRRVESYENMRPFGDILAFSLIELLLAAICIKPVFSKKIKFVLLDILLLVIAGFISYICSMILLWYTTPLSTVIAVSIALTTNYLLLRLLRPAKKMQVSF